MGLVLTLLLGSSTAACGPGDRSDFCSPGYGLTGNVSSIGGWTENAAKLLIDNSNLPVAGQYVYADFKAMEAEARRLLLSNLNFRKDISPYRGQNSFDELVRKFDALGGFAAPYDDPDPGIPIMTLQQRIDRADRELRQARGIYAFLAVYAPVTRMRGDGYYNSPQAGALCGNPNSIEDPNPSPDPPTGEVLEPVIDWCDFPARLRQSVREAANIRMIFGQQFLVDALGLYFNGTVFAGGEDLVQAEVAKLRVAEYQFRQAEAGLSEAFRRAVGNGCLVSDFYTAAEWSLLTRAVRWPDQCPVQHRGARELPGHHAGK